MKLCLLFTGNQPGSYELHPDRQVEPLDFEVPTLRAALLRELKRVFRTQNISEGDIPQKLRASVANELRPFYAVVPIGTNINAQNLPREWGVFTAWCQEDVL